ncbi:hypothetical protein EG68_08945 [Paragonimus skrjabini miyazakii]|uniref:Uncharacterized protein n=1 Tax=Paragonimus skrjabini miyazakii TaxID=59628 RepID=A0A8S9YI03_9TREM|nr:hypothetical protein EG68_08945 [Paragonimus skrjabini miyazakii]
MLTTGRRESEDFTLEKGGRHLSVYFNNGDGYYKDRFEKKDLSRHSGGLSNMSKGCLGREVTFRVSPLETVNLRSQTYYIWRRGQNFEQRLCEHFQREKHVSTSNGCGRSLGVPGIP